MSKLLIVGGGAAGMLASIFAAEQGMEVHLFEQNEKLGKKLFITGKGRCNFTNACATEELFEAFLTNEITRYKRLVFLSACIWWFCYIQECCQLKAYKNIYFTNTSVLRSMKILLYD